MQVEDPDLKCLAKSHQAEPHERDVLRRLGEVGLRREHHYGRRISSEDNVEDEPVRMDSTRDVERIAHRNAASRVEHVRIQKLRTRRAIGLQHCVSQGAQPRSNPECDHVVVAEAYTRERGSRNSSTKKRNGSGSPSRSEGRGLVRPGLHHPA